MFKSIDAQNAACNAVTQLVDLGSTYSSGRLNLLDFDASTLLSTLFLSNPAFQDATDGTAVSNFISDATVFRNGTASFFNIQNRDVSTVWTGTVSTYAGTGDFKLNSVSMIQDSTISITSIVYTIPSGFTNIGEQGTTGIQGATGLIGIQGVTGSVGSQGSTGIGLQGMTGVGIQGVTGSQGITGAYGGPQGDTGVIGPTGTQGETGLQGIQGQGITGLQGQTGIGYGIYGELYGMDTTAAVVSGSYSQLIEGSAGFLNGISTDSTARLVIETGNSGRYLTSYCIMGQTVTNPDNIFCQVFVNGTAQSKSFSAEWYSTTIQGPYTSQSKEFILNLNAGDTVDLRVTTETFTQALSLNNTQLTLMKM